MAILETVYVPGKAPEAARQAIDELFAQPWLTVVQFNREIAREGSLIASRHRIITKGIRDCAYVATAKLKGAACVFTFDENFVRRFAANDEGVTVCLPFADPLLF